MTDLIKQRFDMIREKKELSQSIQSLVDEGTLNTKFFIFTVLSSMIAALGLIMNNVTIMIGAMLIAPLLIPVISLSIGVGSGSLRLIFHSIKSLTIGLGVALLSAIFITWIARPGTIDHSLYETFTGGYFYSLVAGLSGIVAVYSWLKPNTSQIIPGAAIAVALVPPTAFAGALIAINDVKVLIDVFQLVLINLIGIFLGGLFTFLCYALFSSRPTLDVEKQVDEEVEKKTK